MSKYHDEYLADKYKGMTPQEIYDSKKGTLEDALNMIQGGDCLLWPIHGNEPKIFLDNLHTIAGRLDKPVEMWCAVQRFEHEVCTTKDPEILSKFHFNSFFYDGWSREAHPRGLYSFFPVNLHNYGQELHRTIRPNVFVAQVSPMDEHGFCHMSCDLQWTLENFYGADKIIFEVNPQAPVIGGETALPIFMADVVYEVNERLYQLGDPPMGEAEKTVAEYCASVVKDRDCIQLGFGGIPNAIGRYLTDRHDLGIHTEQIGSAMAHLLESGVVTNRYKNIDVGMSVGAFIIGDDFLYHFVDKHPRIRMKRGRYTNDPFVIMQNENMVSINAALQIDLTGQVAAEAIGTMQFSGTGGATDFAYGAYHSKGGRAMLAQISTTKKGTMSRIQPILQPGSVVSVSRNLTDMVVTEYGIAKLRQRTVKQRVENLIAVAHPDFRAELRKDANKYMYY
ncbi:MAG: acetyl-CoA hydrolase/transferase C-terminal domain-containing protein [Evtepia sp.]